MINSKTVLTDFRSEFFFLSASNLPPSPPYRPYADKKIENHLSTVPNCVSIIIERDIRENRNNTAVNFIPLLLINLLFSLQHCAR